MKSGKWRKRTVLVLTLALLAGLTVQAAAMLIFVRTLMGKTVTLEEYNIQKESTLHLVLRLTEFFSAEVTKNGLTVTPLNGEHFTYTLGSGFTLDTSGSYTISGEWMGDDQLTGGRKSVITVPGDVIAAVPLNGVTIDVSGVG